MIFKKEKLLISFSGGRSSAYMLFYCLNNLSDKFDFKIVFSNTGKEVEETLIFIQKYSDYFSVPVVWVEFDLNSMGKRTFKIVDFDSADRMGLPFEKLIKYMGIPSAGAPFCSTYLKREVIRQYMRSIGWLHYYTAIGIRVDEIDRVSKDVKKYKLIYPLIENNISKNDVNQFWQNMPFDLKLDKIIGNCDCCWKKSFKTLREISLKYPDKFNWWIEMEKLYGHKINRNSKVLKPNYTFYRLNKSAESIKNNTYSFSDPAQKKLNFDISNGCSESCEVF